MKDKKGNVSLKIYLSYEEGQDGGGGLVTKSCLTLLRPLELYSPPGSSAYGTSQARVLEWVAISFSKGYSQPKN